MQIEDYFSFLAADDIRLKGTRIGIETILFDYLFRAERMREEQRHNPPPVAEKLRKLRAERDAMRQANDPQVSHG